jgi:hypothetical protein
MRTDGQTDMTKLIGAFRSFTNAPKIDSLGDVDRVTYLLKEWERKFRTVFIRLATVTVGGLF